MEFSSVMKNKPLAKIYNNVNYNLHHYPFLKGIKSLKVWYVVDAIWQDYVENGMKNRIKQTDNFKP